MREGIKRPEKISDLIAKELPKQQSWIGEAILPKRGITLVGGLDKIGKSFINLEIARALTTGQNVMGHPLFHTEICRVLLLEQEIGEIGLQDRVRNVMVKEDKALYEDRFFYVSQEPEMTLDTEEGREIIAEYVNHCQPNVLIFDPIANFQEVEENDNTEVGKMFKALAKLRKMFEHLDLSIVISHHFGKPPRDDGRTRHDPLDRKNFRGALRWIAAPDCIWTVHRNRELGLAYEAWETQNRVIIRNGSSPSDFSCTVNRDNDRRVKFAGEKGKLLPLHPAKPEPPPTTLKGTQSKMGFLSD
jgi:hypothetical protein